MPVILPFKLKLPGTDELSGLTAVSTSFRVHGFLSLEGEILTIQWGGAVQVQEVGPLTLSDKKEILPDEQLLVPLGRLYGATLVGGWLRPRLRLQAREVGVLAEIPGAENDAVQFWYARRDRLAAAALAEAINAAI